MQPSDISAEMERVRLDFRRLLNNATSTEFKAGTNGTNWTNEQLLFHMLFGYLLVHNLLPLVKGFARLPRPVSKTFAATLNAASRPFHLVNYLGSLGGGRVLGRSGMERLMDAVVRRLQRFVTNASEVESQPRNALPDWLGPVLPRLHDPSRHLPLPDPALRPPPTPTHIGDSNGPTGSGR